eukprot:1161727-Pelagomonas_calceolata.AAC.13
MQQLSSAGCSGSWDAEQLCPSSSYTQGPKTSKRALKGQNWHTLSGPEVLGGSCRSKDQHS